MRSKGRILFVFVAYVVQSLEHQAMKKFHLTERDRERELKN